MWNTAIMLAREFGLQSAGDIKSHQRTGVAFFTSTEKFNQKFNGETFKTYITFNSVLIKLRDQQSAWLH